MKIERDHSFALESCRQAQIDWPDFGYRSFVATWDQRPPLGRDDAAARKFEDELYVAALAEYLPGVQKGIEMHSRDEIQRTCAAMSAWLIECIRTACVVVGSLHQNSAAEEIAAGIRLLTARQWNAPERQILQQFLHDGERIESVYWDRIETDRGRVLLRSELASLCGKRPEDFTSPEIVEEAQMDEARNRVAASQAPWESNYYTTRSGRRIDLADIEGRD
jgi:hypothetical protein